MTISGNYKSNLKLFSHEQRINLLGLRLASVRTPPLVILTVAIHVNCVVVSLAGEDFALNALS